MDFGAGYGVWSQTYDELANPIVALDQRSVLPLLQALDLGRTLDAACGTGRHTETLRDLGHSVVGVDASAEMLAVARAKLPSERLALGTLEHLPIRTGAFDSA